MDLFAPQVLSDVTTTDATDREGREWNDKITHTIPAIARRLANLATAPVSKIMCVSFVPPAVNKVYVDLTFLLHAHRRYID